MRKLMSRGCWVVVLVLLVGGTAMGQESTDPWVDEIASPFYFAVRVEDVDRSVEWYRTIFGLTEAGGSEADDGSWRIENLTNDRLMVEIISDDRAQEVERARGLFKVGWQVADVESIAARIEQATGERPRVVEFAPLGIRLLQIRDPDGNIIQLSSPI